jgi:hypothetical protein
VAGLYAVAFAVAFGLPLFVAPSSCGEFASDFAFSVLKHTHENLPRLQRTLRMFLAGPGLLVRINPISA